MEITIDTLHIVQRDGFVEDHFVKRTHKESINKALMEDRQSDRSTNKSEVLQMFFVDR